MARPDDDKWRDVVPVNIDIGDGLAQLTAAVEDRGDPDHDNPPHVFLFHGVEPGSRIAIIGVALPVDASFDNRMVALGEKPADMAANTVVRLDVFRCLFHHQLLSVIVSRSEQPQPLFPFAADIYANTAHDGVVAAEIAVSQQPDY